MSKVIYAISKDKPGKRMSKSAMPKYKCYRGKYKVAMHMYMASARKYMQEVPIAKSARHKYKGAMCADKESLVVYE